MPELRTFESQTARYQESIENELKTFSKELIQETKIGYGSHETVVVEAFCSLLSRGGKRIRGMLTMAAYEMLGGQDESLAVQAASAVEIMHAYILAIDDLQDHSDIRRGGPTIHRMLELHSEAAGWTADHADMGRSLAKNAALIGCHEAQIIFAQLDTDPEVRLEILKRMNKTMVITAHGQTGDLINPVNGAVTKEDIHNVMLRKTAFYTILNPFQIGMMLGGANEQDLHKVEKFSMYIGEAFQAADDIISLTSADLDKDPTSDIREGKVTQIILYARENAGAEELEFLNSCLGDRELSREDFDTCVKILEQCGAIDALRSQAEDLLSKALKEIDGFPESWSRENVEFLKKLCSYMVHRTK